MVLDDEAVALADIGHRRRGAKLGLLDRAARDADEVMVMAGLAGDEATAVEAPHPTVGLEQGERPVHGREPDRAARVAGRAPELLGRERVLLGRDEPSEKSVRWRVFLTGASLLKTLLILN